VTSRPLAGLRVIDLSRLLPGPYASLVLAEMGADVIKVESTDGGDYLRWMPPLAGAGDGRSSWAFGGLNAGKRSICVDLKHPEGRDIVAELAQTADVLLESFRPGVMERLGLGAERLCSDNPRLVYCAISGYGQDGAFAETPGHDLNYLALSGALGLAGPPDAPPPVLPVQVADISGSLWAIIGILGAIEGRHRTGRGARLDISMTEAVSAYLTAAFAPLLNGAARPAPRGRDVLTGGQVCYRTYACKDGGYFALAALEPKFWSTFCQRVGHPDWVARQFDPNLGPAVAELFATRTRDEWEALLSGTDACAEPVLDFDAWRAHPLTHERGVIGATSDGALRIRSPMGARDAAPLAPAPGLGEHTREVLLQLGRSAESIDTLVQRRVIR
jgi:alpha-methylacyl-CoA racemase